MWYRIAFALIAVFFVVMNLLLWRAEISGRNNVGGSIPSEIVWKKILTAPDESPLEIRQAGQKIGAFRWTPSVGQNIRTNETAQQLEGMVKTPAQYDLDFEGQLTLAHTRPIGFNFSLTLATNYTWQDFSLRFTRRPEVFEVRSFAEERALRLTVVDGGDRTEVVLTFEDLQNPEKLLRQFAGPWLPTGLLAGLLPVAMSDPTTMASGIEWRARSDTLKLGSARIRGYRLEASLFGRLQGWLFINTLGEIVRIELPDYKIVIVNEGLVSL